ncbi:MAG TPA: NUDIX domain-containing protein [Saprospiraceae bacterium]|nr:NUDIX domain-containing protein [Saprospiraceae bacterium]
MVFRTKPVTESKAHVRLTVRLILEQEDHVVALKRRKKVGGGYGLIGGTVDKGETPKEALIREAFEEVGISLDKDLLKLVHVMHRRNQIKLSESIVFFFKYLAKPDSIVVKEAHKFKEIVWLPVNNLPVKMSESLVEGIVSSVKGIDYSEMIL